MSDILTRKLRGRFRKALIIEHPDPLLDQELLRLGIEPHRIDKAPDEAGLVALLREGQHDLIFKRSRVLITDAVLSASQNLAAVMLCCIGDDSVDKVAAARHGVLVTNDPVSNGRSVAEMVIGEMIVASRRIVESVTEMSCSKWSKNNALRFEVKGKHMGILGLGKIGRQVAQLAEALGMEVFFHDTDEIAVEVGTTLGWRAVDSLEALMRVSNVLTVHVSATDIHGETNEGLLKFEHLSQLGADAPAGPRLFINLARGFVHTPEDLRRAIEAGSIHYGFVDVFPDEPSQSSDAGWRNPYEGEPRVMSTPHIGAATLEAQPRIARYVARTCAMLDTHGSVRNCVFMPKANISVSSEHDHILAVVHSDTRGTKKAVDDAIYAAGINNLQSAHVDFPAYGIAYDLSALERPLSEDEIDQLIREAARLTGDPGAIRAIRMISPKA